MVETTSDAQLKDAGMSVAEVAFLNGKSDTARANALAMAVATRTADDATRATVKAMAALRLRPLRVELLPALAVDSTKSMADDFIEQLDLEIQQAYLEEAPLPNQKAAVIAAIPRAVRDAISSKGFDLKNRHDTTGFTIPGALVAIAAYFKPKIDTMRAELDAWSRPQQAGESWEAYVAYQRGAAQYSSFADPSDKTDDLEKWIRAQSIHGMLNTAHKTKVIGMIDQENGCAASLEAMVHKVRQLEAGERSGTAQAAITAVTGREAEEEAETSEEETGTVQALSHYRANKSDRGRSNGCYRCGKPGHVAAECRGKLRTDGKSSSGASGQSATSPRKKSYKSNSIQVKSNSVVATASGQASSNPTRKGKPKMATVTVGALKSNLRASKPSQSEPAFVCQLVHAPVTVKCSMGTFKTRAMFDTGSQVDVMPEAWIRRGLGKAYNRTRLSLCPVAVTTANSQSLGVIGMTKMTISCKGQRADRLVAVSTDASEMILNREACEIFQIFKPGEASTMRVKAIENKEDADATVNEDVDVTVKASRRLAAAGVTAATVTEEQLFKIYEAVFDDKDKPLPIMHTEPMTINLVDGATPYAVRGPRPIPLPLREPVKVELDNMVQRGVLEPVTGYTEWMSHLHYVRKKDGRIRIVNDLRKLNAATKRPIYPSATPDMVVNEIPAGTKYFSTLDAASGYWQIPLAEESRDLTTCMTPWGRYRYTRGTMGLISAGDEYTRRTDEAFRSAGCHGRYVKIVDDVLTFGESREECVMRTAALLEVCMKFNITLGRKKAVLARPSVTFAGFVVSERGHEPAPEMLEAVTKFPKPINRTDLRSFCGLVNQMSNFQVDKAGLLQPLSHLLQKRAEWVWNTDCDEAFSEARKQLTKCVTLTRYQPKARLLLLTDASRLHGLGFVLMQCEGQCNRPLQVGSRALSDTEARYSVVEVEALAAAWAMRKAQTFLAGRDFTLVTDHKPLVGVYAKSIAELENPRLQRLRVRTQAFQFDVVWTKGKTHFAADALSRNPVTTPGKEEELAEETGSTLQAASVKTLAGAFARASISPAEPDDQEGATVVVASVRSRRATAIMSRVEEEAERDTEQIRIRAALDTERWTRQTPMGDERENLSRVVESDNLVMWNGKILIPANMRHEILAEAHMGHTSAASMVENIRAWATWPGLAAACRAMTGTCEFCQKNQCSKPMAELPAAPSPAEAWEEASADFFDLGGKKYLVYADKLSNFFEVKLFPGSTAVDATTRAFAEWWSRWGPPGKLRTDGGPQFTAHGFEQFCSRYRVAHEMSSPRNPASNGHAEAAVKKAKRILGAYKYGSTEYYDALYNIRTMRNDRGRAPADVVMAGEPEAAKEAARTMAEKRGKRAKGRRPENFEPGDKIRMQDDKTKKWDAVGTVLEATSARGHRVQLEDGRIFVRSERFLRKNLAE